MINFKSILLSLSALLISCGGGDTEPDPNKKTEVVATTTMIADMVRKIGGDDITVIGLIKPGIDPHNYNTNPRVTTALINADFIIYNGMHLESKLVEAFEKQPQKTLKITDLLPKEELISAEAMDEEFGDPHVWGDPQLWSLAIPGVVAKLSELEPEKKADFEARGKAYQQEIEELHLWAKKRMEEIPKANRILITSHDAFNYFKIAYDIEVYGIQGISTVDEPSGAAVLAAIDLIKEKGVKAVFPESSVNADIIKRISKDSGAKMGDHLFSDSCGKEGEATATYIGMMKHNVNTIVDALK